MSNLIFLNDEQLRRLAKIIYYQEAEAIKNIKFRSESELAQYVRDSKAGYECVVRLLDAGGELECKFQNDNTRSPIAHDIFSYVKSSVKTALQQVRNYTLRMNYLNKIKEHAKTIMTALQELDPKNVINVKRLAKEAVQYRNAMFYYTRARQSPVSRSFSKWLNQNGLKFQDLVQRYQAKLKFEGPFKNLGDVQKLKVYEEIIAASGRARILVNQALGVAGIAVLLFVAGMMVWDIFSSEHILQTATRNAVVTVASVGGAMLGEVVGTVLATKFLVGAQASALFVMMAGIITGILGAFILGTFAGWLIDVIFNSGGSAPLSTDGHRCYIAPMPDGEVLARQIAHQS